MLEATYNSVHSSFRAVLSVADHFSKLRQQLVKILRSFMMFGIGHRYLSRQDKQSSEFNIKTIWSTYIVIFHHIPKLDHVRVLQKLLVLVSEELVLNIVKIVKFYFCQGFWEVVELSGQIHLAPRSSAECPERGLGPGEPSRPSRLVAFCYLPSGRLCRTLLYLQDVSCCERRCELFSYISMTISWIMWSLICQLTLRIFQTRIVYTKMRKILRICVT